MNDKSATQKTQTAVDKDQQISLLHAEVEQLKNQLNQQRDHSNKLSHYLDEVLTHLPIGVTILEGPELKYLRINQYLATINGLPIDALLGQPMLEVMPHLKESVYPIIQEVQNTGKPSQQRELEFTLADGSVKQLVDFHFPLGESSVLSMVLDITERKSMVNAVSRSKDELEANIETLKDTQHQLIQTAKLASIGQLTAGLAHELNQPMGRIFLTAELIQSIVSKGDPNNIDRVNELLQRIMRDVTSANKLMSHLRMYSRQDVTSTVEPIDLTQLIDHLMVLFIHRMKLSEIEFEIDLSHQSNQLQGDPGQIEQVINNLMSNAIDALNDAPVRKLSLHTFEKGNYTCIEIKDSGCGMSQHVINNMFDPFFTTKESGQGTGLGLSISKGIVENHDGLFEVNSKLDEGTQITVSLPNQIRR
jgi:C4-dicarboxylate-specific signal transduction histidine kinase